MPEPKSLLRGLPELALAIDKRIRRELSRRLRPGFEVRHVSGSAPDAPQISGASIGGGGDPSDSPAYPESFTPLDASYVVLSASNGLASERVLTAGNGLSLADAGAGGSATLALDSSVVRTSGAQNIGGSKSFSDPPEISSYLRLDEQSGTPSASPSSELWIYSRGAPSGLTGGRLYAKDDSAAEHDLSVQSRQTFWAAQGDLGSGSGSVSLPWAAASFAPSGSIVSQSSVSATSLGTTGGLAFPAPGTNTAATSGDLYGRWEWTSSFSPGPPFDSWQNSQLAISVPMKRSGGSLTLRARLRVNSTARLSAAYLSLNDAEDTGNIVTGSLITDLTDAEWYEAVLADIDISGWGNNLRALLTVQGTLTSSNVGLTQLDLEWLIVEQWVR